jgi:hypothetical protein
MVGRMEQAINDKLGEPLDEERELMDLGTRDWDFLEELPPFPISGAVLTIRLSREEFTRLAQAARAEGLTTSQYVKLSALSRVMQDAPN